MVNRFYVTDTDLSERFPLYTRANVGEVFPDPVTPLTSDTALWYAELGWRDAWVRMGAFEADEFPADRNESHDCDHDGLGDNGRHSTRAPYRNWVGRENVAPKR
jgi:hypothetical protein